jgi:hypothetical protein
MLCNVQAKMYTGYELLLADLSINFISKLPPRQIKPREDGVAYLI